MPAADGSGEAAVGAIDSKRALNELNKEEIEIAGLPDVAVCPLKIDTVKVEAKILRSEAILDPENDC